MANRVLVSIIFLALFFSSYAQIVQMGIPLLENYSPQNYQANNDNWAIEQDNRGIMYFGNSSGILEFDGNHWTNIAPGVFVYAMAKDKHGRIYTSGDNDFGYIGFTENGQSKFISLIKDELSIDDYTGTFYSTIIENDTVYFLSNRGYLYKWSDNRLTKNNLAINRPGRYKTLRYRNHKFYLQAPDGLSIIDGESVHLVSSGDFFKNLSIEEIFQNGQDTLMIVTRLNGLFSIIDDQIEPISTEGSRLLKKYQVYVATKIDSNYFAFGSIQNGVLLTDKKGNVVYWVNRKGGLQSNDHCEIFTDNRKNIWCGLENGISSIYTNSPFAQLNEYASIPMSKTYSMLIHNGIFYIGTAQGAYFENWDLINTTDKHFKFIEKPGVRKVMAMCEVDNQFFLSTSGTGTYIVDKSKASQIAKRTFKELISPKSGYLFGSLFYGGVGILKRTNNQWSTYRIFENYPSMYYLTEAADGRFWVVEDAERIMSFNLNPNTDSIDQVEYFDTIAGVTSFDSITIFRVNDEILFGTSKGTYKLNNNNIEPYDVFNKCMDSEVYIKSVKKDVNGECWFLGKNSGNDIIGKIVKTDQGAFEIKKYVSPLHRLSNYLVTMFYPYDDENIFIGTSEKIISFNPQLSSLTNAEFPAYIHSVELTKPVDSLIFGGTFCRNGEIVSNQPKSKIPVLPFTLNAIRFSYSALFYEEPKNILYQYKLVGYNKNWSDWSGSTVKEFNYLPEGKYTFQVKAKNIFETESEMAAYSFVILAPWYRSVYAIIVYLFLFMLIVYLLIQIGINRLKKENIRLEHIVDERTSEVVAQKHEIVAQNEKLVQQNIEISEQTNQLKELNHIKDKLFSIIAHDLRSPLLSLYTLISLTKDNIYSEERFRTEIGKLSNKVGHTRELTENLLSWAQSQLKGNKVNPALFSIFTLVNEKIEFFAQQVNTKNILLKNEVLTDINVVADKDMIEIVLRNLIANAIKFCNSGNQITISTTISQNFVTICIADNGTGISPNNMDKLFGKEIFSTYGTNKEKGSGLGLMLCKDFVNMNGGQIWAESTEGLGSTFFFTLPIDQKE